MHLCVYIHKNLLKIIVQIDCHYLLSKLGFYVQKLFRSWKLSLLTQRIGSSLSLPRLALTKRLQWRMPWRRCVPAHVCIPISVCVRVCMYGSALTKRLQWSMPWRRCVPTHVCIPTYQSVCACVHVWINFDQEAAMKHAMERVRVWIIWQEFFYFF